MKKNKNSIGTMVLIAIVSLLFAGCNYFNRPLLDYLEEWTNTAQVSKHTFDGTYPEAEGYTNIPSGTNRVITYYVINPQNYTLDSSVTFAHDDSLVVNNKTPSDFATVEQDASDKSIIRLTLNNSVGATGILPLDGTGTAITPTITITEPNSGRNFGSYTVPVRVNSAPAGISSPIILCNTKDNTYVICFNMPDMNTTSSIHRDIVSLTVSGFYNNTYTVTAPDNSSGNGLTGVISSYNDTNYREVEGSFIGNKTSRFVGIETGISLNTVSDPRCTITLTDSSGLTSVVTASTEAPPLPAVTASFGSGTLEPGVPVIFNQETAGSTITLTLSNAEGVAVSGGSFTGDTATGSSGITLTFLKKGTYTVTATAGGVPGARDTTTTFTYTVPYSAVYIADTTANGSDDTGIGSPDKPYASLTKAAGAIGNDGVVYVKGTVSVSGEYAHSFGNLTLRGYGVGGKITNRSGRVFTVESGGSLTLGENITLTGTNDTGNGGAVYVNGGTFTMEANSKITGSSASSGGGVYVADGSFTMNGTATLQGNMATTHGGGVHIYSGGTFTMNGGTIDGTIDGTAQNTAKQGGGVFVSGGTFNMNDGTISGNTVTQSGGGVYVNDGNFTMKGGTIGGTTANTAEYGGGVCVYKGDFTMSGGAVISGNNATDSGGGVFVQDGKFTMEGGTIGGTEVNSANEADLGGGVYVADGTFTMNDGTIGGIGVVGTDVFNYADVTGGGVYVGNNGTFTMNGGIITGNESTSGYGGGVYLDGTNAKVTLNNTSSISGNQALYDGGGVYVGEGTFTLSGSPVISDNIGVFVTNNVYLASGNTITIGDEGLTGGTIGVTAEDMMPDGAIPITDKDVTGADRIFTSDVDTYSIVKYNGAVYLSDAETVYEANSGTETFGAFTDALSAVNSSADGGTITLLKDIDGSNAVFGASSANNQPITFSSDDGTRSFILDLNGYTIDRGLDAVQSNGSVIKIVGGTLTIKDSSATNPDGTGGKGMITGGNSGGGGGGIHITSYSTGSVPGSLILESGSISGNTAASSNGGGIYIDSDCALTMKGGSIDGNTVSSASNYGGGVFVYGTFTMENGIITKNSSEQGNGGGVNIGSNGTFTMIDGTISDNDAGTTGGGVNLGAYGAVPGATMTLKGGTISDNTASYNGGGVGVSVGTFTMNGGTIGGTKLNTAKIGGGVYVDGRNSNFIMTGGTISGNTATQKGGGVYVSSTGSFTLGSSSPAASSPVVSENTKTDTSPNNVYLDTGKTLFINGILKKTEGAGNMGISMATLQEFTSGWSNSGLTDSTFFFSDDPQYKVEVTTVNGNDELQLINK